MDLRQKFDNILKEWGHNIVLQRKGSDGSFGGLERHTVRHMNPSMGGLTGAAEDRPEGIAITADMVYYFRFDVNPKEGDRIYEDDVNLPTETTWIADYALPMRGRRGQIIYWAVGATRETD